MSPQIVTPTEEQLEQMIRDAGSCQDVEMYEMYLELVYLRTAVYDLRKRLDWAWNCHTNLKQILSSEKEELQKVIGWYNKKLDEAYSLLQANTGLVHHYQKLDETSIAPEWFDSKLDGNHTVEEGTGTQALGSDGAPLNPGF